MLIRYLSVIVISGLLWACIDSYYPRIDDYLDLPVVEGSITNEPGPYIIKLSRSITLDNMNLKPITGARIVISDDSTIEETLIESERGVYTTSATGIRGEAGKKYRITIEIDSKTYQSNYEELQEPIEIDSIYTRVEYKEITEGPVEGLQFYIDTEVLPDNNRQFLWTFTETYKYNSELLLDYTYFNPDSIVKNYSDTGTVCWQTEKSYATFTCSAENFREPKISHFPLHYINNLTNKLSERYSVLVNQYTISEEAYHYWNEIEKQQAESGSLYTRQPYQISGNLKNINDPEDNILGFFMVAGVSQKRMYIDRPSLTFNYSTCSPVINLFQNSNPYSLKYPLYAMVMESGDYAFAPRRCFACQLNGGTLIKPDFWEK